MTGQLTTATALLFVAATLAGCGSPASTPPARQTAAPRTPSAVPSPSAAPVPSGPYAVVVSNSPRQGSSYDVMLIDLQGAVVTRVTAKLPLLKPNQTLQLPLVSASNDLVYYLDGDTEIHSLAPTGATALAKSIPAGSTSILAFSVSPDNQRIAVSLVNQSTNASKDTGRGYVEDLADAGNHVDLFNNTSIDAFRWPVGWHGTDVIDAVGNNCGYGQTGCVSSYHVISSTTGARDATVCETAAAQPSGSSVNTVPEGLPVGAGVACDQTEYYNSGTPPDEDHILAVSWSGAVSAFAENTSSPEVGPQRWFNCSLAPVGAQMACTDNTTQALTLLARGAAPHSLGRKYNVLGWIDSSHLLVDVDSTTLAVLTPSTGVAINLTLPAADKVDMIGVEPGAL